VNAIQQQVKRRRVARWLRAGAGWITIRGHRCRDLARTYRVELGTRESRSRPPKACRT